MREVEVLRDLNPDLEDLRKADLWRAFTALSERSDRYKAWLRTFYSERPFPEVLSERSPPGYEFNLEEHSDLYLGRLQRSIERSDLEGGGRVVSGDFGFFQSAESNIWTAFTSEGRDFFEKALSSFLQDYRPTVSPAYSSSKDLQRLLSRLEREANADLIVQKAVLYSHQEEGEITFKKRRFHDLFAMAEEQNMYVDKVEFTLEKPRSLLLHAFVSRDGTSYFYGGDAKYLQSLFLPELADASQSKTDLLRDRERQDPQDRTHPVDIVFERPVLEDLEDNERLLEAIGSLSRGSLAVFHDNPYIHASFLDLNDGASYEVFATENNRISIVPNFSSSVYSLSRLVEKVFKDFQEGDLKEPEEPDYQMEDFLAR